jgi:hypothetical protein
VTRPTLNPGPGGRVVEVVVVGAVDVVLAVGRVAAEKRCAEVDVADVSSTATVAPAATAATTMIVTAVTLPDGRLRFGLDAWRAMVDSFAAAGGDQKSDLPLTWENGVLGPEAYSDRLARRRQEVPVL